MCDGICRRGFFSVFGGSAAKNQKSLSGASSPAINQKRKMQRNGFS
jgi:hypothetical protein